MSEYKRHLSAVAAVIVIFAFVSFCPLYTSLDGFMSLTIANLASYGLNVIGLKNYVDGRDIYTAHTSLRVGPFMSGIWLALIGIVFAAAFAPNNKKRVLDSVIWCLLIAGCGLVWTVFTLLLVGVIPRAYGYVDGLLVLVYVTLLALMLRRQGLLTVGNVEQNHSQPLMGSGLNAEEPTVTS